MNNLEELLVLISEYEVVKRYKRIENIIFNENYKKELKHLKNVQKKLVNAKYFKKDIVLYQEEYNRAYDTYYNNPVVIEFMNSLDEVLNLVSNICNIIEQEINIGLK